MRKYLDLYGSLQQTISVQGSHWTIDSRYCDILVATLVHVLGFGLLNSVV